MLLIKKKM